MEDQAKSLNSIAAPDDQRAVSPLVATAGWLSRLPQAVYKFVVVNFDILAQASEFRNLRHTLYGWYTSLLLCIFKTIIKVLSL